MRRKQVLFVLAISLPLSAGQWAPADTPPEPSTLPPTPAALQEGFAAIDEAELRAWLGFLRLRRAGGAGDRGEGI